VLSLYICFLPELSKEKAKVQEKKVENPHQKRQERKRRKEEEKSKVLASFESH